MMNLVKRLWSEEEGQGMVEYGLIIALVSVIAIVGLQFLGEELDGIFERIGNIVSGTEG